MILALTEKFIAMKEFWTFFPSLSNVTTIVTIVTYHGL